MKHIILFLALLSFTVNAQDYKVTVQYNGTTKTASLVWTMPAADAQYFNARFGTDELAREAQQLVNRIRARIAEERERDAQRAWRWLTKAQQDAAIQKEQQYRDTVGTFERNNPPTQGALYTPPRIGMFALRNVGKAVLALPDIVPTEPEPANADNGYSSKIFGTITDAETGEPRVQP